MYFLIAWISGKVVDKDGNPIPYAFVSCDGKGTYTDDEGNFKLEVEEGCILEVQHVAFRDTSFISKAFNLVVLEPQDILLENSTVEVDRSAYSRTFRTGANLESEIFNYPFTSISITSSGMNLGTYSLPPKYTLILLDGMPIYGRVFEGIDLLSLPLDDITDIHVLPRSLSSSYGSNAMGVVNLTTSRSPYVGVWLSSRGSYSISSMLDSAFGYKLYASSRIYDYIEYRSFGTSFSKPIYMRLDFSRKSNTKAYESFRDVRAYFKWNSVYINYFSHTYFKRKHMKSYTNEIFLWFERGNTWIHEKRFAKLFYGFNLDVLESNLLSGIHTLYELYTFVEFGVSNLNTSLRIALSDGELLLIPNLSLSYGYANLSVGLGYRRPSMKELYMYLDHSELGYRVQGNSSLSSEKLVNASFEFALSKLRLALSISRLWNYIDVQLLKYSEDGIPIYTYANTGTFNLISHEGSFESKNFEILWNVSNGSFSLPKFQVNARLMWKSMMLEYAFKDATELLPSYGTLNIYYTANLGNLKFSLGVRDVFNWNEKLNVPYLEGRVFHVEVDSYL